MRIRSGHVLTLGLMFFCSISQAAQRVETVDEDADGRKETTIYYEGTRRVKAEADMNNDAKPDFFVEFRRGVRSKAESDSDFDGVLDSWMTFDSRGDLKKTAKDTNKDKKPDYFSEMLEGRNVVLREMDRNFDGPIDRRWLTKWDGNKRLMTGVSRTGSPEYTAMPGYITLWAEEDNNYDGKIDAYTERGNTNPSKEKIGQPIEGPKK